eukprot:TRINITY_DN5013_c0_g2_i1.p1 TRINITY_DN5013_c0_g2~~TRINITY_DN5013_c0_g2_i1.p1  ORF type:complete len:170 (-),score=9.30 TRINITY_DN5013_c0_g2_i1:112-621(-)
MEVPSRPQVVRHEKAFESCSAMFFLRAKQIKAKEKLVKRCSLVSILAIAGLSYAFWKGRRYDAYSERYGQLHESTLEDKVESVALAFMGFACWVAGLNCIEIILGCSFQSKNLLKLAIFSQITALILWIVGVAAHFVYELNSTWHTNLPWSRYDAKLFVIRLYLVPAIL